MPSAWRLMRRDQDCSNKTSINQIILEKKYYKHQEVIGFRVKFFSILVKGQSMEYKYNKSISI
jgi:hypothetical protein